ncbi:MAG: glycosyltransferase [Proteobacteria bacterium]|nr:glycosyltransferase [Pseudomonadota bacterium]
MMKIIHFHPNARYAKKFVAPLMNAERDCGYETQLVVSSNPDEEVAVETFPFNLSIENILGLPLVLWRLKSFLKLSQPDIIFSHNSRAALLPLLAALWSGVPVRVYFNHGVPYPAYTGPTRWLLRALEYCNLLLSTRVVTVSKDMVDLLNTFASGINPSLINEGSACGVDLGNYAVDLCGKPEWCKRHGLHVQDLIVVYIGRAEKRKGFDFILRLFVDQISNAHIKLVLCGPSIEDVSRVLHEVPHNIIPLGFVNDVPEVLAYANVLLLPSLHEGLSYAVIEAQAAGTLVVANNIPGLRCIIEDGVTGFLVDANDPEKYADIIRQVDLNREGFLHIQQQASDSVTRFSRDVFMLDYVRFLDKIYYRKKICFVATTAFAVNAFLKEQILALSKIYKVILCVDNSVYPLSIDLGQGLTVIYIRIERKVSLFRDIKAVLRLIKIISANSPDVVHTLTPKAGLLGLFAAWVNRVPIRCHTFTGQVWVTKSGLARYFLKQVDRFIVAFASNIFVDSNSQRQMLYRETIAKEGRIDMLGTGSIAGVNLKRFRPDVNTRLEKRRELGLSVGVCVYLFVGRITIDKGLFDLLTAFKEVAIDVPNVELWVVGPDEENLVCTLKNYSSNCNAPIRWFTHTTSPEIMMAAADVLLLPSYREGFGSVIIEAAACELPAVAYRIDGVIDAIEEHFTGILVDVGNVESFAAAMKTLALDEELRVRLGRYARDRVQRRFSSELVTGAWLDFYQQVFDRHLGSI